MTTLTLQHGVTYWFTRDLESNGQPSDVVEVWSARPTRIPYDCTDPIMGGGFWMSDEWDIHTLVGRASLDAVRKCIGTIPDDDRMCIRADG